MITVYLNGNYIPRDQAKIDVLDRGFIFADGIYEVITVYQGHLFHLDDHLERLEISCQDIQLNPGLTRENWRTIFAKLLEQFPKGDYSIYLQVTRGTAPVRDHTFPNADEIKPTVYVQVTPLKQPSKEQLETGLAAVTTEDIRWKKCYIKAISLLPNVLARQQAKEANADEAILLRDGYLTEGSLSNVFIVKDGMIKTPPSHGQILAGITRKVILELAKQHTMPYEETAISQTQLENADEIWISNSSKEVAPITLLDGRKVGDGKPGNVWKTMYQYFQTHKDLCQHAEELTAALSFPATVHIKVIGKNDSGFENIVRNLAAKHFANLDDANIRVKHSNNEKKYLAITVSIEAQSQEQLDNFYKALKQEPTVIMAL